MFSCLFGIIKYICIGIFWILVFTLPIWMLVGGFVGGASAGGSKYSNKYEDWNYEQIREVKHEIVIHWENGEEDTRIVVREDIPYTINGCDTNVSYYNFIPNNDGGIVDRDFCTFDCEKIELPSQAYREGYELVGFYTGQHGGSLVINAAGYGVITITSNLDIYANWKSVEN